MIRNASIEKGVVGFSRENQHYFVYKGRPVLPITSAEMYGAVITPGFDYVMYFDTLKKYGLNYTRIYPGAFVEKEGMSCPENMLAPGGDLMVPWARSDTPGYIGGGNKFDLNRWDDGYFKRLSSFLEEAEKRDILVELCFFNCQYPESWEYSPLNAASNIQGIGTCDFKEFVTLSEEPLVMEQEKYIEKLIMETNHFGNIIYEFVDEPTLYGTNSQQASAWISRLVDKAIAVEDGLPKKHLLAQQLEIGVDFTGDDRVSLIVAQYIALTASQIGGMLALKSRYECNKPIELNETAFLPYWYNCEAVASSRIEAWEFMVGGGAAFNQLNGFFTVSNPGGVDPLNTRILEGLSKLREFMESFEYIKMKRDESFLVKMKRNGCVSCISEPGRQYAMYVHHSRTNLGQYAGSYYIPESGDYRAEVTLKMKKGEYIVEWLDPASLQVILKQEIAHEGGALEIDGPGYTLDIALRVKAKKWN